MRSHPGYRRARVLMVLVMAGTMAVVAPAGAEDLRHKQDQTRARRQQLQSQIDLARASNDKVESELARLNKAVSSQTARVADAEQAEAAGRAELERASRRLAYIEQWTAETRRRLALHAVDAYMHGGSTTPIGVVVSSRSIGEAAQRRVLLSVIQSRTSELLDALAGSRKDLADARRNLERVQQVATARARTQSQAKQDLVRAQQGQEATSQELERRISHFQEESRALAAEESRLQAVIRSREAAAQAARAREQAAARESASTTTVAKGGEANGREGRSNEASGNAASDDSGKPTDNQSREAKPATATTARPKASTGAAKPSTGGYIWPLHGPVTSEFGPRWGTFHSGMDIAAPDGTPIKAAKAGIVILASWFGGYGNFVLIDHGGGIVTAYGHQSRIAAAEGQSVSQGQVIGYEGSTGHSTGPHLHFEVRVNGVAANPRNYVPGNP